jgi:hypothetical protein
MTIMRRRAMAYPAWRNPGGHSGHGQGERQQGADMKCPAPPGASWLPVTGFMARPGAGHQRLAVALPLPVRETCRVVVARWSVGRLFLKES